MSNSPVTNTSSTLGLDVDPGSNIAAAIKFQRHLHPTNPFLVMVYLRRHHKCHSYRLCDDSGHSAHTTGTDSNPIYRQPYEGRSGQFRCYELDMNGNRQVLGKCLDTVSSANSLYSLHRLCGHSKHYLVCTNHIPDLERNICLFVKCVRA